MGKDRKGRKLKEANNRTRVVTALAATCMGRGRTLANELLASKHGDVLNSVHVTGARAVLLRGVARPPPPPGQSGN